MHGLGEGTTAIKKKKSNLNSTCGRFFVCCLTCTLFSLICLGLSEWNSPDKRENQTSVFTLLGTIAGILFMYAVLPIMSKTAGMVATDSWKPYFACYRLSFLFAMPAFICIGLGPGQISSFGVSLSSGTDKKPSIDDLRSDNPGQPFELRDAFVGTNLSKSLVRTLNLHEHGEGESKTTSRYQQAEYLLSEEREDLIEQGIALPTVPPDTRTQYLVAPVFKKWEKCVTRQRISTLCVENNPIAAWAIAQQDNLCVELGMVACNPKEPILDPVYHCSEPNAWRASSNKAGPYAGLCGRTRTPPDQAVIDQLLVIMRSEGWTDDAFPKNPIWIDVRSEACIGAEAKCQRDWELMGTIGIVFAVLTGFCILTTMVLDCQTDRQIRRAKYYAQIKAMLPPQRPQIQHVKPQGLGKGKQKVEPVSPQSGSLRSLAGTTDTKGKAIPV